ncbi:DNA replication and repair protein RecO [Breoghania corrubedonensis]|uniref:DNA repair protein RecO n=1 Tax=Breoghania corrubedonensis TaxID=665038 RepID=A0A2T5VC56_9HYPH|nr:DNA repair protein RecO [Breoghania corrubedonensis]PTW61326.1 DNA replication and repair protein RecO [Breoghania corrubedonensis]
MEWTDDAIILGTRRHGETSAIVEAMTATRGRHMGLVRGGRSRKMQPTLQPGNSVHLTWRARLDGHLGNFQVEGLELRAAALMETPIGIHGVQTLAALLRLLPERDPHPNLYAALQVVLEHMDDAGLAAALLVRFELEMLNELGVGLDLSACAATGVTHDLIWVSPKSGRAVSREAGAPYADKLLPLPAFLHRLHGTNEPASASLEELSDAFRLTGFFLDRHVYGPRELPWPTSREAFVTAMKRALAP